MKLSACAALAALPKQIRFSPLLRLSATDFLSRWIACLRVMLDHPSISASLPISLLLTPRISSIPAANVSLFSTISSVASSSPASPNSCTRFPLSPISSKNSTPASQSTAEELASGESFHPDQDWEFLDSIHYDLNTCLRETVSAPQILSPCSARPATPGFQDVLHSSPGTPPIPLVHRARHLAHRRIAFLKGQ